MATICISNQKGGVGKTTTAVTLAAGLARRGRRVLLVDLDIQGSASAALGVGVPDGGASVADVLIFDRSIEEVIRPCGTDGLFVAPAGELLATVDMHLASAMAREFVLDRALAVVRGGYDDIVIDTAPYLGLLTINALAASDWVLVPVSCEYLPILGLKLFTETLARIRKRLGVRAEILGYLLTMYDRRERITLEVEQILRRTFGDEVLPSPIRINTRHKAAPSHRQTIYEFEGAERGKPGKGVRDYEKLVDEVIARQAARTGVQVAALSAAQPTA
jgi:chromosome partitioning protein